MPNEGSGSGGWEKITLFLLSRGSGSSHLGQSGLQVCWMRVACVCTTCTPPALKHDMSIQTLHSARLPIPCPSFSLFFLDTARGGVRYPGRLTRARGRSSFTWCGPLGDFRWQRCASGAGPDLGPFHPKCISTVPDLGFCKMQQNGKRFKDLIAGRSST